MGLSSRWLDLDRVAKSQEGAGSPFETARNFILAMMEALPKNADSKVNFDLDQASLGGEAVSGIQLEVARAQGVLLLNNLRAGLPGGSKLALDGAVADAASGQAFRGDLTLHGTSLARFLDWAAKDKALAEAVRNEGPFSLQGRLAMSENGIDLTEAGAEIAGRPITGEVHYGKKDRPRLAVVLDGSEIDAAQLWPAGVGALKGVLASGGSEAAPPAKPAVRLARRRDDRPASAPAHRRAHHRARQAARRRHGHRRRAGTPRHARLQVRHRRRAAIGDRRQRRRRDQEPARLVAVDLRCTDQGRLRDARAAFRSAGGDAPAGRRIRDPGADAHRRHRASRRAAARRGRPCRRRQRADQWPARRLGAARRRPRQLAQRARRYHGDDRQPRRGAHRRRPRLARFRGRTAVRPRRKPARFSSRRSARRRRA